MMQGPSLYDAPGERREPDPVKGKLCKTFKWWPVKLKKTSRWACLRTLYYQRVPMYDDSSLIVPRIVYVKEYYTPMEAVEMRLPGEG